MSAGRLVRLRLLALLLAAAGCAPAGDAADTLALHGRIGAGPAPGRTAESSDGMVVSGSEYATRVGALILGRGGNAVDAAVATAFALAVTEPTQSGLGGRTQALVRTPDGRAFGVDATTEVPAGYDPDAGGEVEDGYGVIAIPGTLAGLTRLLAEAGTLPLAEVVAPAVALAEHGFPLSEGEADRLREARGSIARHPTAGAIFLGPGGTPLSAGDTLRQPDLARVLRAIAAEGPSVFYEGWIAEAIAADMTANGGWVTAADLAAFEAEPALVVRGAFGALDLIGTYIPASGATTIEALQILDRVDLSGVDDTDRPLAVGAALLAAFEDRETAWNDPRPPAGDAAWIVSTERAEERAAEIRALLRAGRAATPGAAVSPPEPAHTTHVSVVDRDGAAVAMTQSLGPSGGSGVVTPGLGFLYATTLGGYLGPVEPGDRPWSSQSPLIAERAGATAYVLGGAGARRILSALVQTVVRIETEGATAEAALAAARFHPAGSGWTFELAEVMPATPEALERVRAAGYDVRTGPSSTYFARLNVITLDPTTGVISGVADPRWAWGAASPPR